MSDRVFIFGFVAWAVGLLLYSGWWCVRAWGRIWGRPQSPYESMVYQHGARGFGLLMWGGMALVKPVYDAISGPDRWTVAILRTSALALLTFPLYLWFGHLWGRGMAWFFGVKDSSGAV